MKQTVEEAEEAEPLLAQKLYDSFRKTNQRQVDRKLAETGELLKQGFEAQATPEGVASVPRKEAALTAALIV